MKKKNISNKKKLYAKFLLGIFFITLGILYFFTTDNTTIWLGYANLAIGILHVGQFFYDLKNQYLIIDNCSIQKGTFNRFKTKIDLAEIQEIKRTDGSYILKSDTKKIKIDIDLIDNAALLKLMEVLKKADLPPEKNYFSKFKTQL